MRLLDTLSSSGSGKILVAGLATVAVAWFFMRPPENAEVLMLDRQMYSKQLVINEFIHMAVSEARWNNDDERKCPGGMLGGAADKTVAPAYVGADAGDATGWWRPFMAAGAGGWPSPCVVHKWDGSISIGIDWPNVGPLVEVPGTQRPISPFSTRQFDNYEIIEDQVRALIPDLQHATGRRIVFHAPEDKRETSPDYARIRIVPVNVQRFKITQRAYRPHSDPEWNINSHEAEFWGGVPFSDGHVLQTDGYLLPRPDNSMGMAVCKIFPGFPEDTVKALVTECVLRSLGLPEVASLFPDDILSDWNGGYYKGQQRDIARLTTISSYDRLLLHLLYCPVIKSGMTGEQVRKILAVSALDCLNRGDPVTPAPVVP